jgi:hypothetical protein
MTVASGAGRIVAILAAAKPCLSVNISSAISAHKLYLAVIAF